MKLAIASTTLLFAMMAAQATVLSVAPVTGVNLVKRAPNGGEDDEQSAMATFPNIKHLPKSSKMHVREKTSPACTKVGAVVDKLKEKIANLEEQLKMNKEEYQPRLDKEIALKEAMRLDDYSYLRTYLSSQ
ncbi:hypothetical protein BASA83_001325 [Batrachochytrium salamandrivorans]|nr:hypothetical protein BASA83_001325 [Batrachochytrium salamandrivorans]